MSTSLNSKIKGKKARQDAHSHLWQPRLWMAVLALCAVPTDGWAWRHTNAIFDCEVPINWYLSDSPDTPDFAVEVISEAFDAWLEVIHCEAEHAYMGVRTLHHTGYDHDAYNTFYFGDSASEVSDGTLAQTRTLTDGNICHTAGGESYTFTDDADVVFNDDITWLTTDEANHPECVDGRELKWSVMHQVGHMLGLGHSCEEGESCPDADKRNAVMYWDSPGACVGTSSEITEDDIAGIRALYGGWVEIEGPRRLGGGTTFEYCLDVTPADLSDPDSGIDATIKVEWGGGSLLTYLNQNELCYTYENPGEHNILVNWETALTDHDGSSNINSGSATFEVVVPPEETHGWDDSSDDDDDDSSSKGCITASPIRPNGWLLLALGCLSLARRRSGQD